MWQLVKLFIQLFTLKRKPQDIPYSKALLGGLVIIFVMINVPAHMFFSHILAMNSSKNVTLESLNLLQATLIVGVYLLFMCAAIYSFLTCYKLQGRLVQVLSSLLGIEIILTAWFIAILLFPLSIFSALLFILLLYWQFMVHIHIFVNSFASNILVAGIFALVYILMQHNIDEFLVSIFMTVG